jgi:hypothetical protein
VVGRASGVPGVRPTRAFPLSPPVSASVGRGGGLGWVLWAAASGGLLNEHFVVILTHWVLWLLVLREFYSTRELVVVAWASGGFPGFQVQLIGVKW